MVFCGCKKEDKVDFDRKAMATELVQNVILPRHQQLQESTDSLYQLVQQFQLQPTLSNFQSVREKWVVAKATYKYTEVFNLGTIRETVVHNKLNKWPANTEFIDGFLVDSVVLDQVYVDGKGSTSKGLAAMEYLLFNTSLSEAEMFDTFISAADADRRMDLLLAYATDLFFKAYFLNDLWLPTGDNYGEILVSSTPTSGLESPTNLLVNEMVARVEAIVHTELGAPLGTDNGGTIEVEDAEAFRSKQSLKAVRAGVVSLRETFTGALENAAATSSLRDHLITYGAEATANDVVSSLDDAVAMIDALNSSLEESLITQPAELEEIRQKLQGVIVLLKTEVVSTLSITLTFNDNDGD